MPFCFQLIILTANHLDRRRASTTTACFLLFQQRQQWTTTHSHQTTRDTSSSLKSNPNKGCADSSSLALEREALERRKKHNDKMKSPVSNRNGLLSAALAGAWVLSVQAFVPLAGKNSHLLQQQQGLRQDPMRGLYVSTELDRETTTGDGNIPQALRVSGSGIPGRKEKVQLLDSTTYESSLIKTWEADPNVQKGFDWEVEKARRFFAGLRMREDGSWVRQPSFFDFLVSRTSETKFNGPAPVGMLDVAKLVGTNTLAAVGFGPALGMAAVPTAVIQKYEGSFFSFIKGILGGDLQTLAGGPLFLLLAKYFETYGPIFNLSL